LSRVGVPHWT